MTTIHEAIFSLNSSIVTIRGDVAYDANEQVVSFDMAQAEAKLVELKQKAIDTKASALAKLTALGLTQAEVTALVG